MREDAPRNEVGPDHRAGLILGGVDGSDTSTVPLAGVGSAMSADDVAADRGRRLLVADIPRQTKREFERLAERLASEYTTVSAAGVVMAEVFRAREELSAQGVRAGLMDATEAAARRRLRQHGVAVEQPALA